MALLCFTLIFNLASEYCETLLFYNFCIPSEGVSDYVYLYP